MNNYNYFETIKDNIQEYIKNEVDFLEFNSIEDLKEKLYEDLFTGDSITGNANGSYTFNTYQAEENLCHNWDLLERAMEEFGNDENPIKKGAEWCDVTIRCYLLAEVLCEVIEEIEEDFNKAHEEWEDITK